MDNLHIFSFFFQKLCICYEKIFKLIYIIFITYFKAFFLFKLLKLMYIDYNFLFYKFYNYFLKINPNLVYVLSPKDITNNPLPT